MRNLSFVLPLTLFMTCGTPTEPPASQLFQGWWTTSQGWALYFDASGATVRGGACFGTMPLPQLRSSGDFTVTGTLVCECGPPPSPGNIRAMVPATYVGNVRDHQLLLRIVPSNPSFGPFGPFTFEFDGAAPRHPLLQPCP